MLIFLEFKQGMLRKLLLYVYLVLIKRYILGSKAVVQSNLDHLNFKLPEHQFYEHKLSSCIN